ncbi:MAG: cysteine desulfurase family protein [Cyanobacteriota bacterium]
MYYFDNNATTPIAEEVLDEMLPYLKTAYYNPSAPYKASQRIKQQIETARESVAKLLGTFPQNIIFTSSGSEANNLAIIGIYNKFNCNINFITSKIEHSSVLKVAEHLESKEQDVSYLYIEQDGRLNKNDLFAKITDKTKLVSIQWVNSETGVIQDISDIGKIIKKETPDTIFHVDAVQAVGKIPINLEEYPEIDLLSISAHKFYGPKGVGALYYRDKSLLTPIIFGGKQEHSLRAGTENVAGIIGMGKAAQICKSLPEKAKNVENLRDYFEEELQRKYDFIKIHGKNAPRVFNTSFISFGELENNLIIARLDQKGICVSGGSACSSGAIAPSHVLTTMGLDNEQAWSSVRFSFGHFNTLEDINFLISELDCVLDTLHSLL